LPLLLRPGYEQSQRSSALPQEHPHPSAHSSVLVPTMGKSAKFFKRPSLKEKQRREQFRSSDRHDASDDEPDQERNSARTGQAASSKSLKGKARNTDTRFQKSRSATDLDDLKRQAREMQATIKAEKAKMSKRSSVKGKGTADFEQDDEDNEELAESEEEEEDPAEKPKRKRRSGRAAKRYKVPEGEARTPAEAGIDYLAQFEGKKDTRIR
jgi:hypothetical protein